MAAILNADGKGAATSTVDDSISPGDIIKDSKSETFTTDVIDQSAKVPVLVDFWAPWCGPCKQLGPILEKLAREYGGKVRLVKINVDENQQLAAQMQVQSIPMVVAFKDGRPVDGFAGALPESQLRQFFEKLTGSVGSPLDQSLDQASTLLAGGDHESAKIIYRQILSEDPANATAHAGVANCLIDAGDTNKALAYLQELEENIRSKEEVKRVLSAIELTHASAGTEETESLRQKIAVSPNDPQLRYDLAVALYGEKQSDEAVDILVELVKTHKSWNDEAARTQLLKIFQALGHADPVTIEGRRKLSTVIFS